MGAGRSLNGREKISGEEKATTRERAPGDKLLTDQFQTVGVVLASDWCQKFFAFSAQSQSSKTRSRFAFSYTKDTYIVQGICEIFKADLKLIATELLLSPKGRYKCPKQHTKSTKKSHWWNMPNFASKMA